MNTELIIALFGLFGTTLGSVSGVIMGNKLISYRLTHLEKKVEKHETEIQKILLLEQMINDIKEDYKNER